MKKEEIFQSRLQNPEPREGGGLLWQVTGEGLMPGGTAFSFQTSSSLHIHFP